MLVDLVIIIVVLQKHCLMWTTQGFTDSDTLRSRDNCSVEFHIIFITYYIAHGVGVTEIKVNSISDDICQSQHLYSKFGAFSSIDLSFLKVCKLNILLNSGAE